jgi:hypothetical protein
MSTEYVWKDGVLVETIVHPDRLTTPQILSASGFQELCETALGGGTTGAVRFGEIMRALGNSVDDLVFSINSRFLKSITFDKTKSAQSFAILVSKNIITAAEKTAILSAWPQV